MAKHDFCVATWRGGSIGALGRIGVVLSAALLSAPPSFAATASSPSFQLVQPTLSSGGGTLTNTGSGVTARAQVSVGQPGAVGVAQGSETGVRLEAGYWPAVMATVPEAGAALSALAAAASLTWLRRRRSSPS